MENLGIKKVLVTGSEGYIGAVLVPYLIKQGYEVVGVDANFYQDEVNSNQKPEYELINADLRVWDMDLSKFDAIIHLAALSNDPMGEINPQLTNDVNYEASVRLAKMAKKDGVKRFIFSSSCSVYGIAEEDFVSETSKVNPLTAYAVSKVKTENDLIKLADANFTTVSLRNSTVYGFSPKFRNDLVVNNLTTTGLVTKKIQIKSDGTPWRPLIEVRDLATIFGEFLKIDSQLVNGEVFNIGFKENNFQVKDVANIIGEVLPDCEIVYTGEHGSDSRSYRVDFGKFESVFPHIKQEWTMKKSVIDLVENLKRIGYSLADYQKERFIRLADLKQLLAQSKLSSELFWKEKNR